MADHENGQGHWYLSEQVQLNWGHYHAVKKKNSSAAQIHQLILSNFCTQRSFVGFLSHNFIGHTKKKKKKKPLKQMHPFCFCSPPPPPPPSTDLVQLVYSLIIWWLFWVIILLALKKIPQKPMHAFSFCFPHPFIKVVLVYWDVFSENGFWLWADASILSGLTRVMNMSSMNHNGNIFPGQVSVCKYSWADLSYKSLFHEPQQQTFPWLSFSCKYWWADLSYKYLSHEPEQQTFSWTSFSL